MKTHAWLFPLTLLLAGSVAAQETRREILFIVDGSGSMWGQIEGETKIAITQKILAQRIAKLPDNAHAGLIAYGHRRDKDCEDIETLVELQPLDRQVLLTELSGIKPKSMTPIAAAIAHAVGDLGDTRGTPSIILMTDGKETCAEDPCAAVKALRARSRFFLHVVGFDIVDEQDALQLQCIAAAGGGNYYTAATVEGLDEAFREATAGPQSQSATGLVQENVEIVLDTSAAMLEPFEETTRLEVAIEALRDVLQLQVADRDNLAFRRFGGACAGDNTELVLDFGRNIAFRIDGALHGMRGRGETTLVDAVNAAIFDFDSLEHFEGMNRRILIITGGIDPCYAHERYAALIRQRLENRAINPEFRFVGIDLPPDQELDLVRIAAATGGEVANVHSGAELGRQIEAILEIEPAAHDIDVITGNFNELIERVGQTLTLLEKKQYDEVETEIERLRELAQANTPAFRDLGRRRSRAEFAALFENARNLRTLQLEMIGAVEALHRHHRSGDADAFNDSARAYNNLTGDYARHAEEAARLIRRLRARTTGN